jgi:hypothetical protein
MKINVDIECSPEEARAFFGLPNVTPMQDAVMEEIQDRVMSAMKGTDAETLLKTWVPAGVAGLEQMQKMFWQSFSQGGGAKDNSK